MNNRKSFASSANTSPSTASATFNPSIGFADTSPRMAFVVAPPTVPYEADYAATLEAARGIPDHEFLPLNIDLLQAVTNTLGNLGRIAALRPEVERRTDLDPELFQKLQKYTHALWHAQGLYGIASAPKEDFPQILERAVRTRQLLISDVQALSMRGYLDGALLKELKGAVGHRNVASDLYQLVLLLKANWATCSAKTGISAEELADAQLAADNLAFAIGERDRAPQVVAEAAEIRQRIFTLFARTYDQVRGAISYVRWQQDDADEIMPSLYAGRVRRRGAEKPTGTDVPEAIDAPVVAGASVSAVTPKEAELDDEQRKRIMSSLPGGNPFIG